jgi:hypothetical protein
MLFPYPLCHSGLDPESIFFVMPGFPPTRKWQSVSNLVNLVLLYLNTLIVFQKYVKKFLRNF